MALGSVKWERRTLRIPDRPLVEWVRVECLRNAECTIGMLRNGTWVVDTADGLADLNDNRALTFVFPLLQLDVNEVRRCLGNFLLDVDFDRKLLGSFPFVSMIVRAIEIDGYWAEQSFRWLEGVDLSESDQLAVITALKQLENNRGFSQKLRHEAMKQRIRLERIR